MGWGRGGLLLYATLSENSLTRATLGKGLYINDAILFWAILDNPLPPVIMSSFDIHHTHPLMTSFMYKITAKMYMIKSNLGKRMTDLGPLHLEHFFIYMKTPS